MRTDNSESFRRSRIEHIQHKQAQRVEKLRQLRREMDELEATDTTLHQELSRAQSFNPSRGICPRCAIDDGETVELKPISIGLIVVDDLPKDVDVMRCPKCDWDDTVTS